MWPAQLQAQIFLLPLKICFADAGFLPLCQGIRGSVSFCVFYTFSHTFVLRFIDFLVIGVGCTCFSALLIFFIILLDANSALWLGW